MTEAQPSQPAHQTAEDDDIELTAPGGLSFKGSSASLVQTFTQVVGLAALVGFIWYELSTGRPGIVADMNAAWERVDKSHREDMLKDAEADRQAIREIQSTFKDTLDRMERQRLPDPRRAENDVL